MRKKIKENAIRLVEGAASRLSHPGNSIVITGFWRSGTTWLQSIIAEAMQAKIVFEPLHPRIRVYKKAVCSSVQLPSEENLFLNSFMPFCRDRFVGSPRLKKYIRTALTGGITDPWVRRGRSGWKDFLRRHTVVKLVRGQLLLPTINQTFSPSHIHIQRDPRAVIASIRRGDWGWWMEDLSLKDQLLNPKDHRSKYFNKWRNKICSYDECDFLSRVIVYWALTEKFVEERGLVSTRGTLLSYEELCREKERYLFSNIPLGWGVSSRQIARKYFHKDSPTTEPERKGSSMNRRIYSWKREITSSEEERILSIVEEFDVKIAQ